MEIMQSNIRPDELISSIRIEMNDVHWRIHIWNKGGKAGTICVNATDGPEITKRLQGDNPFVWDYS